MTPDFTVQNFVNIFDTMLDRLTNDVEHEMLVLAPNPPNIGGATNPHQFVNGDNTLLASETITVCPNLSSGCHIPPLPHLRSSPDLFWYGDREDCLLQTPNDQTNSTHNAVNMGNNNSDDDDDDEQENGYNLPLSPPQCDPDQYNTNAVKDAAPPRGRLPNGRPLVENNTDDLPDLGKYPAGRRKRNKKRNSSPIVDERHIKRQVTRSISKRTEPPICITIDDDEEDDGNTLSSQNIAGNKPMLKLHVNKDVPPTHEHISYVTDPDGQQQQASQKVEAHNANPYLLVLNRADKSLKLSQQPVGESSNTIEAGKSHTSNYYDLNDNDFEGFDEFCARIKLRSCQRIDQIKRLQRQQKKWRMKVNKLNEQVSKLSTELVNKEEDVRIGEANNKNLYTELTEAISERNAKSTELTKLQDDNRGLTQDNNKLESLNLSLRTTVDDLMKTTSKLEREKRTCQQSLADIKHDYDVLSEKQSCLLDDTINIEQDYEFTIMKLEQQAHRQMEAELISQALIKQLIAKNERLESANECLESEKIGLSKRAAENSNEFVGQLVDKWSEFRAEHRQLLVDKQKLQSEYEAQNAEFADFRVYTANAFAELVVAKNDHRSSPQDSVSVSGHHLSNDEVTCLLQYPEYQDKIKSLSLVGHAPESVE